MDTTRTPPGLRQRLSQFFYAEEVPYGLALMRICLPLVLLAPSIPRWFHARELFSLDGAPAPLWENFGRAGMLPIPGGSVAVALMTLYMVSLVTLSCGWMTRTSALIAGVLTGYLGMLDTMGTLTKFVCIATHALLLLSLSQCGSLWSVDAWIASRRRPWPGELDSGHRRYPAWPRRLIQIMLAVVYFAAAITKMQTPAFFSGDQMYFWLLTNVTHANPLGEYAAGWPPMLIVMAIATVVWEVVFPFLCWRGLPKAGVLIVGVIFHLLTLIMLGIIVFPFVCLSMYWAYFDAEDIRGLAAWLRRRRRQWAGAARWSPAGMFARPAWLSPSVSASGFALLCAAIIGVAVEVERRMDVYGEQRPEGRYTLAPMDTEQAEHMLAGLERVSYEDQWHAFDVGSQTLGGLLANRREAFDFGETAIVECCVNLPHGDLWLECNLHDRQDRLLQRSGQVMVRERVRAHFNIPWKESYPAGEYDLVLKLDGNEVARRRVRVGLDREPSPPAPAATAMAR